MSTESSLQSWLVRVAKGDQNAARELFDRYAERLIGLAATKLNAKLRRKEDPEDVVQSVLKSFFHRHAAGQYDLTRDGSLWHLLAAITVRKCANRGRRFSAGIRNAALEESGPTPSDDSVGEWRFVDRKPGPEDAAILREEEASFLETLERLRKSLNDRDREILDLSLLGKSPTEIHQMTEIPLSTVFRIVRRLRKRLEDELGGDVAAD